MKALAVVGWFAISVVATMWRGYVLSVLWAWFIVTALHAPMLGVAQAIGVSIVVALLTHQAPPKDEGEFMERMIHAIALGVLGPLVALAVGWVVRGFLP